MTNASGEAAPILHIARRENWRAAASDPQGDYIDPSLATEGFIHCSTIDQVLIPANERFVDEKDLVLLVIDPARLAAPTVFEDLYESGQLFPHVYGPISVTSVLRVVPFPAEADGSFQLPEMLR